MSQEQMPSASLQKDLMQRAQRYFQEHIGVPLDELLQPIEPESPTGKSVRGNGVYTAIREARREDDPTLPQGAWTHELKQADWDKVSDIAAHALLSKSKDLQLAAWLLEAQIAKQGFEAIPPCITLITSLCERYWTELYPRIDEGDQEYRANVVRWINEKLLPQLRLLPITDAGRSMREYGWADFEQARRNEQVRAVMRSRQGSQEEIEGATLSELQAALSATSTEHHLQRYRVLADALNAIEVLAGMLEQLWGDASPSLNGLAGLLEQIQAQVAGELYKRGVRLGAAPGRAEASESGGKGGAGAGGGGGIGGGGGGDEFDEGPIRSRADAYHRLAVIAEYLATLEPHSPAPYLLRRVCEWGNMNTAELYNEVFVRFGGQLSIFELLGIDAHQEGK